MSRPNVSFHSKAVSEKPVALTPGTVNAVHRAHNASSLSLKKPLSESSMRPLDGRFISTAHATFSYVDSLFDRLPRKGG